MIVIILAVIIVIYTFNSESLTEDDCTDGDVRLEGTPLLSQGRVEICFNSSWGTICRDSWDNRDAAVVCEQLGFGRDGKSCYYY